MATEPDRYISKLLPKIFRLTARRDELRVLDLGVGLGRSMEIVAAHRPCQYFFADIGHHVAINEKSGSDGVLPFEVPDDTQFDICFFWDYLNLMSEQAVTQFASEIDAYLGKDTLIHCFLAVDLRIPMQYKQFEIKSQNTIEHIGKGDYTARYPKTRVNFEDTFLRANCDAVVLHPGNRLEVLANIKH